MGPITLFGTIYESHCIISNNFYLYLQYFQLKIFSFNKIADLKRTLTYAYKCKQDTLGPEESVLENKNKTTKFTLAIT